ncbi:hypothetical protein ACFXOM_28630 [Streptomyces sp. NPDC059169]|uniref:hypothetical protein n=1 Tax=Streptomyces sp. NPDC059169 TaxID=3346754 RepID=UPI0036B24873
MGFIARTRKNSRGARPSWMVRSLSALAPITALSAVVAAPAAAASIPQAADSAPEAMFSGSATRHCAQWVDAPPNVSNWFCAGTVSGLGDEINARGLHELIDLYDFGSNHQLSVVSSSPTSYCGHSVTYGLVPYLKTFDGYVPHGDCAPTFMSSSDASPASAVVGWPSSGLGQRTNHVRPGFPVGYLKLQWGWKQSEAKAACATVHCSFFPDKADDTKYMPSQQMDGADIRNLTPVDQRSPSTTYGLTIDESSEVSQTIEKEVSANVGIEKGAFQLGVSVRGAIADTYSVSWGTSRSYTQTVDVVAPPNSRIVMWVQRPATEYTGHFTLPSGQVVPGEFSVLLPDTGKSRRVPLYTALPEPLDERQPLVTPEMWRDEQYPTPTPPPPPAPPQHPHTLH